MSRQIYTFSIAKNKAKICRVLFYRMQKNIYTMLICAEDERVICKENFLEMNAIDRLLLSWSVKLGLDVCEKSTQD